MTSQPLRPEEERSLREPNPEILGVQPQSQSPLERAERLVAGWEVSLSTSSNVTAAVGVSAGYSVLILTQDVKQRMASDIAALLNDTISREHLRS